MSPGRKQTVAPFGAVTSSVFWSVKGWVESGDENYDYAAIVLPKDLGNKTGWFGLAVLEDNDLKQAIGKDVQIRSDNQMHHEQFDVMAI